VTHYLHNSGNGINKRLFCGSRNKIPFRITIFFKPKKLNLELDIPFPSPRKPAFSFIDLFCRLSAGKTGFSKKPEENAFFLPCITNSPKVTYEANFGEIPFGDITVIDEKKYSRDHDVCWQVFPASVFHCRVFQRRTVWANTTWVSGRNTGNAFFMT
jgi:DNA (cytosine-5)-methyltransferase 1